MESPATRWSLATPAVGIELLAERDGVWLRGAGHDFSDAETLRGCAPNSPLGARLPVLIPQLLELGIATAHDGDVRIAHGDFNNLEAREIDAFDGLVSWAPYTVELESSGWLGGESFCYRYRFYLGIQVVSLTRLGCFVRRGDGPLQRLDPQTYALLEAIDAFNALSSEAKAGANAFIRFAEVRGLAAGIGAQLDRFLSEERVVIPPRVGLDLITDEDGRVSFVPKIGGVDDEAMRLAFLRQDDVDEVYAVTDAQGGRLRVVLNDEQREVLRRMQRVRRLGGAERAVALRDPHAVFDGVAGAIDIDPATFGPRVKGIGDFPFLAQPYLRRGTGVLDVPEELVEQLGGDKMTAGITCKYADGHEENIEFETKTEVREFQEAVERAWKSGAGTVNFRDKSIVVDEDFVGGVRELADQVAPKQKGGEPQRRRFLLIYTNENELEYEEPPADDRPAAPAELPVAFKPGVMLKQHQQLGLAWLQRNLRMGRRGCLLADDMGMGKTLQVLTFLAWAIERGELSADGADPEVPPWDPILIVAPLVLIENGIWIEEMRAFFAGDGAVFQPWLVLRGAEVHKLRRAEGKETVIGDAVLDLERLRQYRVVFTNYETVTNYQHSFARMKAHWSFVITDEAQEYKVPSTKISHALKSLAPRFRVACTGTPVETRLLDVWNIFDFLQPGHLLGSAAEFSRAYERGEDPDGGSNLDAVKQRLRFGTPDAFLLRRDKTNLPDLPAKLEHELRCELSPEQRQLHLELVGRARRGGEGSHPFSILAQLMRAYQHPALLPRYEGLSAAESLARCPKLAAVIDCLRDIRQRGEKALVFTRHIDMQQLLALAIGETFGRYPDIVNGQGGGGSRQRARMLRGFRESDGFDTIILSPDVAGLGLTLTEANHVIHYGRWWNPAKEAQATDRAHRIGQTRPVHVYYPIAEDPQRQFETFDEKLHALIARRRALAAEFLMPPPSEDDVQADLINEVLNDTAPAAAAPAAALGANAIRRLTPDRFEAFVAALEARAGHRVIFLPRAGNEGVTLIAIAPAGARLIQCVPSDWGAPVRAETVGESIRLADAFRARHLAPFAPRADVVTVLATRGTLDRAARAAAGRAELLNDQEMAPPDLAALATTDLDEMVERRLGSMRDVEAALRAALGAVEAAAPASPPRATDEPWIDALFASPRYQEQRDRNLRLALADDRLRDCLRALAERGGRMTRRAFALRLAVPELRAQSILAGMRHVLNIEGIEVLSFDEPSQTIELNRHLLTVQFGLRC